MPCNLDFGSPQNTRPSNEDAVRDKLPNLGLAILQKRNILKSGMYPYSRYENTRGQCRGMEQGFILKGGTLNSRTDGWLFNKETWTKFALLPFNKKGQTSIWVADSAVSLTLLLQISKLEPTRTIN